MSYSSQVIADGAAAYWRLGETSGLTFADASGNGKTATVTASTGLTYGVRSALSDDSTGLATDGTQAALTFANIVLGTTCTFEFWISLTSGGATTQGLIGAGGAGDGIYCESNRISCIIGAVHNLNTTVLAAGVRYHVVVSITAGAGTFYLNGVSDGTFTGWLGTTINSLFNVGSPFILSSFLIDEVAIYTTALTGAKAAAHYAAATGCDLTTLLKNHMVVLRAAGGGGALAVDSTTRFTKNIPTMRSGVVVPDCDLPTEIALYVKANG